MSQVHKLSVDDFFARSPIEVFGAADPSVEFLDEGFAVPARLRSNRVVATPYSAIHSVIRIENWLTHFVLIGIHRRLPLLVRERDFVEPDAIVRIAEELKCRISDGPNGPERRAQLKRREELFGRLIRPPRFVISLIVFFVLTFIATDAGSNTDSARSAASITSAYVGSLVASGDLYRLVTAGFLHWDLQHLVANSLTLLAFGWVVEAVLGAKRTALLLFSSSLIGYCALFMFPESDDHFYIAKVAGSSAAVWGLFGCTVFLITHRRTDFPVGFRALWPLWAVIAYQSYTTWSSDAFVLHLAGGLAGLIVSVCLTLDSNRVAMSENPALRKFAVLMAVVVAISGAIAMRQESLQTSQWYLAQIHEQLHSNSASVRERNNYAWALATARDVPDQWLVAARDSMRDVIDGDSTPSYRDTLATILNRLGDFEQSIAILRGVWLESPTQWSASQLARFYDSVPNLEVSKHGGLGVSGESETGQVDARLDMLVPTKEVELRVTIAEPEPEPTNVHLLLYASDTLRGFVNVQVKPGWGDKSCRFDASVFENFDLDELFVRPVWVGRREAKSAAPENSCLLFWVTPWVMNLPTG